jgi:hypothetical protein
MDVTLTQTVVIQDDVLVQTLSNELVLLKLGSEEYFGLDDVGGTMWTALKESGSVQAAYDRLLAHYNADPDVLKQDLFTLIRTFVDHDLVHITQA